MRAERCRSSLVILTSHVFWPTLRRAQKVAPPWPDNLERLKIYRRASTSFAEYESGLNSGYYLPKNILVLMTPWTSSSGLDTALCLYRAGASHLARESPVEDIRQLAGMIESVHPAPYVNGSYPARPLSPRSDSHFSSSSKYSSARESGLAG